MGHRNREIEVKMLIAGQFGTICSELDKLLANEKPIIRVGSSLDTYWPVPDAEAQFLRVRERDGIRQITVKGKDRGDNVNRIEVDIDSTSEVHKIHRLIRCVLGKPAGIIAKTYRVWELESEYDTVCAYEVHQPANDLGVVVEVEARTEGRMRELERMVINHFYNVLGGSVRGAPGSLFEMFIEAEGSSNGAKRSDERANNVSGR